jgi:hypothetical protein
MDVTMLEFSHTGFKVRGAAVILRPTILRMARAHRIVTQGTGADVQMTNDFSIS